MRRSLTRRWLHAHGERRADDASIRSNFGQTSSTNPISRTPCKNSTASYTWFRPDHGDGRGERERVERAVKRKGSALEHDSTCPRTTRTLPSSPSSPCSKTATRCGTCPSAKDHVPTTPPFPPRLCRQSTDGDALQHVPKCQEHLACFGAIARLAVQQKGRGRVYFGDLDCKRTGGKQRSRAHILLPVLTPG